MYYTYILQSLVDKNFYTGYTLDLKLRFKKHNDGKVISTKYRRLFVFIYYEACLRQEDAIKLNNFYGYSIKSERLH